MEEKVASVLKLIEEDGDSFAKRAEMYYKKRPELIFFVEESYRAYRALAERYDHISTELQNANNTIASVCPDRVPYSMDDDFDDVTPRSSRRPIDIPRSNIPQVPSGPIKNLKGIIKTAATKNKKSQPKKLSYKPVYAKDPPKSGLEKPEALGEIDKLQKQILTLQTEKEFVKSSYEGGLAKFWEIEKQITQLQEKICSLQDEFGEGMVIEDDEARSLMAATALKSCEQTLAKLQEKQERSVEEAKVEQLRITETREKIECIKSEILIGKAEDSIKDPGELITAPKSLDSQVSVNSAHEKELAMLKEKIKEHFEVGAYSSLTVSELAEKIDELVGKVVSLESAISTQTALVHRLKSETDGLQDQIKTLEDDKASLIHGKNDLHEKVREMEKKLNELQDLNQSVDEQNNNLETHFTEACCHLDHLSDKLQDMKSDEEPEGTSGERQTEAKSEKPIKEAENEQMLIPELEKPTSSTPVQSIASDPAPSDDKSPLEIRSSNEDKKHEEELKKDLDVFEDAEENNLSNTDKNQGDICQSPVKTQSENLLESHVSSPTLANLLDKETEQKAQKKIEEEHEPDWKELYMKGMEEREKTLLAEYTAVLRSYKEIKKNFNEADAKTRDGDFDTALQIRELKSAITMKDEEIRMLHEKLKLVQTGFAQCNLKSFRDNEQKIETDLKSEEQTVNERPTTIETIRTETIKEVDIRYILMQQAENISATESKFRGHIDELLEENLEFWFRFSTTFSQIQKFDTEVEDLQADLAKIEERQKRFDGSSSASAKYSLKSDARPLYKHLKEIHTELSDWIETSALLKEELKSRFTSLCEIQEEITKALKESAEDEDFKFTSFQAAKFEGEVLNMKQENNKVADELQAGLDHITTLQLDVEKTLAKMNEELGVSGSKVRSGHSQLDHSASRSRVPLRSFIFGVKQKKQKPSFFAACVHPAIQKRCPGLNKYKSS
ncbi:hypothetical protein ACFE04_016574 [Oxalis oulophora]